MAIVFVHSFWQTTRSYSHAIAALAAELTKSAPVVDMSVVTLATNDVKATARDIVHQRPEIVLFTAMSSQWRLMVALASALRAMHCDALFVVGGIHPTARPQSSLGDAFDVLVVGEGETVIADIVIRAGELKRRAAAEGTVRIHAPIVEDLTTLAVPRFDLFDRDDVLAYPSVMFSRGCPYKCNYCMSRLGGLSTKVRWKSPEQALIEIERLVAFADPPTVYIDDDTLLKNPKWVRQFCSSYADRIGRPFLCNARPETIRAEIAEILATAGCCGVGIGIESGSPRLREMLGRPMTDEMIVSAFATAQAAGLRTWSFNMVGVPGETVEDFRATIALNKKARVDDVRLSIFTPYPGSPMGSEVDIGASGYFRSAETLEPELRGAYLGWMAELEESGRLWLTASERALIAERP